MQGEVLLVLLFLSAPPALVAVATKVGFEDADDSLNEGGIRLSLVFPSELIVMGSNDSYEHVQ